MGSPGIQQMILRKVGKEAAAAPDAARRVGDAGAVVLDQQPSSLLVEGDAAALQEAARTLDGWTAIPLRRFERPDSDERALEE